MKRQLVDRCLAVSIMILAAVCPAAVFAAGNNSCDYSTLSRSTHTDAVRNRSRVVNFHYSYKDASSLEKKALDDLISGSNGRYTESDKRGARLARERLFAKDASKNDILWLMTKRPAENDKSAYIFRKGAGGQFKDLGVAQLRNRLTKTDGIFMCEGFYGLFSYEDRDYYYDGAFEGGKYRQCCP